MASSRTPLARWFTRVAYTQTAVAHELGISDSYMTLLIAGARRPSLPLAIRISELTGLPVSDLVPVKVEKSA